jgi:NlpC/P60 family/Bacterial dipeptidyl-peptidase Sh3 domain
MKQVYAPLTPLLRSPHGQSPRESEMLFGEKCDVIEVQGDYSRVKAHYDGYTGFVLTKDLGALTASPLLKTCVLKTFVYAQPSIKSPVIMALPFLSLLTPTGYEDNFIRIKQGYIYAPHVQDAARFDTDFVTIAARFLALPYLWGGASSFGLDCSALVQIALKACGVPFPRDSHPQSLQGENIKDIPQRGDLVFWQGHVGIIYDDKWLLHANGHTMDVALEGFETAKTRIGTAVTAIKRVHIVSS